MKSQRKSRNIKNNFSDRHYPKHYHMSHNYYRIVGNMSIYMLKSLALRAKKDMNILMGVGVIKVHLKPKHDAKSKHKIIYTLQ